MRTEDYIYQDNLAVTKYPLSKKHVVAIACISLGVLSTYFGAQHLRSVVPIDTNSSYIYGSVHDDIGYEDVLDPTRSLTDILLSRDDAEMGLVEDSSLSSLDEPDVYSEAALGNFENYDEADVANAFAKGDASSLDDELASDGSQQVWIAEEIKRGDTLSSIFSDLNIPYNVMQALANDETAGEAITNIIPGKKLYFAFDRDNNLVGFIKQISSDEQWRFSRTDVNTLDFTVTREHYGANIFLQGEDGSLKPLFSDDELPLYRKRGRLVVANIESGDSFSTAAHSAGLTYNEIRQITELFKGQVQFTSQIQPGDSLRVLFSEDKGQGKINAIELKLKKVGTLSAYRNTNNDCFYDENGYNTSVSTFRRFPFDTKVVISSHFNPTRIHPVTHQLRPHNGTDFALRVGTPVLSPADGVVEVAKYSRSAGYYIIMSHRGGYSTVYMHLSKIQVKVGQQIKIGQVIARSGNTGISTGPHLHYELRLNGRPVNAMRITLPSNEEVAVAQNHRQRFDNNVTLFKKELHEDSLIAQND